MNTTSEDVEKGRVFSAGSGISNLEPEENKGNVVKRMWNSFGRADLDPTAPILRAPGANGGDVRYMETTEVTVAEVIQETSPGGTVTNYTIPPTHCLRPHQPQGELKKKLKKRHVAMIAAGSCVGTGLFVAAGKGLAKGGPASLLLAFAFVGFMLWCTIQSLCELTVTIPVAGSFSAYSTRFIDPAWGFAMGMNYAMQWLITLPLEIIAASILINFWDEEQKINHGIFVAVFLVLITFINLLPVKGYGESEFWFSSIKVVAVVGFIIFGIVMNAGGVAGIDYIGGQYWSDPGAFLNGFKGFCCVLITAAFAYSGTEIVGLTAAEAENPAVAMPSAVKQVFWRIVGLYMTSLCIIGLLVPYNDPALDITGSATSVASPFVIAIRRSGVAALPSIFNVVILIAVLSVGNSAVYGSSRTLQALAAQRQLPNFFTYIDREGRPLVGIAVTCAFGLLAFLVESKNSGTALEWMLALSGLSAVFSWASICVAHLRFREAWKNSGLTSNDLVYNSMFGVAGSWIGLICSILIGIAQFWTSTWPVGSDKHDIEGFFLGCLCGPVMFAFFLFWKILNGTELVEIENCDITTGRTTLDARELRTAAAAEFKALPKWRKALTLFY